MKDTEGYDINETSSEGPNFAVNQDIWDNGNPHPRMCHRKGAEHAAYGWGRQCPTRLSQTQQDAYMRGYRGEPL